MKRTSSGGGSDRERAPTAQRFFLEQVRARDFVLLADETIRFAGGLCAITGDSGAGKSLIIDALRFVTGGRFDKAVVRRGAAEARVEALFTVRGDAGAALDALLDDAGVPRRLDEEQGGDQVTLARTVGASGRGRAWVNGSSVSLATLRRVAAHLLEIVGQHSSVSLLDPEAQLLALDTFCGLLAEREAFAAAHAQWSDARRRLLAATERGAQARHEAELLAARIEDIEALDPQPGELEALALERRWLRQSARTRAVLAAIGAALYEDDDAIGARLAALAREAAAAGREEPDRPERASPEGSEPTRAGPPPLAALAERLDALGAEVADAAEQARAAFEEHAHDEARLARVEDRIGELTALGRRLGASLEDALARLPADRARLAELDANGESAAALAERVAGAERALRERDAGLARARRAGAPQLAARVQAALRELGMPRAGFDVGLVQGEALGPTGGLAVELRLEANPGEGERPLASSASGGELSRALLAIESEIAERRGAPLLILDEIDQNVGARAATAVAERLRRLAGRRQVLVVTHLARIASAASHHLRVGKAVRGARTTSHVEVLTGEPRRRELAAMIGGDPPAAGALREAERLLAGARAAGEGLPSVGSASDKGGRPRPTGRRTRGDSRGPRAGESRGKRAAAGEPRRPVLSEVEGKRAKEGSNR